jgi:6-pyruvoyltetrahydropterin/6-carboxytetrahydropterin synthase
VRDDPPWIDGRGVSATQLPDPQGRFTISKDFELNGVSHELRLLPEGHKCRRNHGHNYVVTLTLTADRLDEFGFVTDFGELASFGDYLKSTFDHRLLNDLINLHPTSELFAYYLGCWFIENVEPQVHGRLVSVRVAETRLSSALWERLDVL